MNRQQRRAAAKQGQGGPSRPSTRPPSPADAPCGSAVEHHKQGRLAEADALYRRALQLDPEHTDSLHFLGVLSLQGGRADEAASLFGRALSLDPDNPALHYNVAGSCRALGQQEEAVAHYRRAIQLRPGYQAAHNNLGLLLHELGRLGDAAEAFQKALALGVDPRAHCNLGALRLAQGRPDPAASHYRQALALAPDSAEARVGLASAHLALGNAAAALREACGALSRTEAPEARAAFVACVAAMPAVPPTEALTRFLQRALTERWGRARELARFAAHVLSHRYSAPAETGTSASDTLAADPLLAALLDAAPVADPTLERVLTRARAELLAAAAATGPADAAPDAKLLDFWCALARQCFLNEHVFACTAEEEREAAALVDRLSAFLASGGAAAVPWLLAAAAYRPLARLPEPARLLARSWPEAVRGLLRQQVEEPLAERAMQAAIPRLTPISDPTSAAVRAQYEDNPYPRWTAAPPAGAAATVEAYLFQRFLHAGIRVPGRDGGHDVLVAGCGTGQQPVDVARSFRDVRVLAVDLSLASLAYAARQTAALGVVGIEYAQADLLRLGETGRRFDMIQASGVLHHLADPMEGWRALLAMLRPGGVMYVGLYSELARRDVVAAREFIAAHGFQATPEDIRRCRQAMMDAAEGTPLHRLSRSSDFGGMSGCRDLLFHVQEHRLRLPEVAGFLSAQRLAFLGFDLPAAVARSYRARFPHDPGMTDLRHWDEFERSHPDTFSGMYQFWIQKP